MTYLLDTNVISELVKPTPHPTVVAWAIATSPLQQYLSVLTLGELEKGITLMSVGARQAALLRWAHIDVPRQFLHRVLPLDEDVAKVWGRLSAAGQASGRVLPVIDGLLLATAMVAGVTLATRNVADVANRGTPVFDPWTGTLHP